MQTALVTGSAGFIGYYVCKRLLAEGWQVIGVDSMSDYYDVALKQKRQAMLLQSAHFRAINDKIETPDLMMSLFAEFKPDVVIHLAAQAGVRYSIENPRSYLEANIIGTFEILEAARAHPPKHMLLASTSSAYGANTHMPYAETDKADHQVSFYAATKKSTENMAHSYAHLFGLPITMFRFFTVYGPWLRPDLALYKFVHKMQAGEPIDIYNHGDMARDFTYVGDLVRGIRLLMTDAVPPAPDARADWDAIDGDTLSNVAAHRVVNIGNGEPVQLLDFIDCIEAEMGVKAIRNYMDMQPGDVPATHASNDLLRALTGFQPEVSVPEGVKAFIDWYKSRL